MLIIGPACRTVAPMELFCPVLVPASREKGSSTWMSLTVYMNLYTTSTGSKKMNAIVGEPRNPPTPAETLDAIALLHASGVGSVKK